MPSNLAIGMPSTKYAVWASSASQSAAKPTASSAQPSEGQVSGRSSQPACISRCPPDAADGQGQASMTRSARDSKVLASQASGLACFRCRAPGAAVHVRYEDDRHYPVDKVVGAGAQDTEPSMRGCSGENCPTGDQTDPVHHKHRCPAGQVVTGIISRSGDWLDSVQYVCSPLRLLTGGLAGLFQHVNG